MTADEIEAIFAKDDDGNEDTYDKNFDEYGKFDRIENKLSRRRDIHAMILMERLVPGDGCFVCSAEHDEIFFDVTLSQLAASPATEADIIDLIRCGIRYDKSNESFCKFV